MTTAAVLTKRELPVLLVNAIYIPVFTVIALRRSNYEFVLYVGVILFMVTWILWKQRSVRFGLSILWGLTIWALLHMVGGNVRLSDGNVVYSLVLVPLVQSAEYEILRYDQVVHIFGFGVATLVCHHLLLPHLRDRIERRGTLMLLVVLMGSGLGAVNEIVEFIAVLTVPETGVGGYENTVLDLTSNLIGGVAAVVWLRLTHDPANEHRHAAGKPATALGCDREDG